MPADKKGKPPTKVDLRRLMQQKKQESTGKSKRIDSPLAKYSSSGQLSCVVCRLPVKSELAWPAHLASRTHKERLEALRSQKSAAEKRSASESTVGQAKKRHRVEGGVPDDFFEKSAAPKKGILKNAPVRPLMPPPALPPAPARVPSTTAAVAALQDEPMDADPPAEPPAAAVDTSRVQAPASTSKDSSDDVDDGQLPEGFFDDPQKDAKARNVVYVDPVEAEWERFQREMQTAEAESELILDEDQQEATVGRQFEEVDEQIRNLSRVVSMEKRKQELATHDDASTSAANDMGDSSSDEADIDEYLDWRSKGAWK